MRAFKPGQIVMYNTRVDFGYIKWLKCVVIYVGNSIATISPVKSDAKATEFGKQNFWVPEAARNDKRFDNHYCGTGRFFNVSLVNLRAYDRTVSEQCRDFLTDSIEFDKDFTKLVNAGIRHNKRCLNATKRG